MLRWPEMIRVTTTVYRDLTPTRVETSSWRVQSCSIDFGSDREAFTFTSNWVYATADAAHDDMKQQALERLRSNGYTVSESEVIWQLRMVE
jgi:hypothetical protein